MIKDPVMIAVEDALKKFAFNDLCEGSEVRDALLDILLLMRPTEKHDGMVKLTIVEDHATPKLEQV